MNGREMREKLHSGDHVYGTMIVSESSKWPAAAASIGLDFAFIDTEHTAQDRITLSWMCQLYAAHDMVPIVRIPSPDPYEAAMVLDGGAQGVIAPYVETVDQVRALVGAVKYRPLKGKKLYDALNGVTPLEPEVAEYLAARNDNNVAIVNIESRAAMDALDDILAVEGLDAVLIGPNDLACNLGIPDQYFHPLFVSAVDEIISKAHNAGLGAGIHVFYGDSMEQEIRWAQMGANLIVHSIDISAFRTTMRAELDRIKGAVEGAVEGDELEEIAI
jgi:2-keto-3-deoxy-L-rhamnonate aldolase RhmA